MIGILDDIHVVRDVDGGVVGVVDTLDDIHVVRDVDGGVVGVVDWLIKCFPAQLREASLYSVLSTTMN